MDREFRVGERHGRSFREIQGEGERGETREVYWEMEVTSSCAILEVRMIYFGSNRVRVLGCEID
jgi:hypothetical protein